MRLLRTTVPATSALIALCIVASAAFVAGRDVAGSREPSKLQLTCKPERVAWVLQCLKNYPNFATPGDAPGIACKMLSDEMFCYWMPKPTEPQ